MLFFFFFKGVNFRKHYPNKNNETVVSDRMSEVSNIFWCLVDIYTYSNGFNEILSL